MSKYDFPLSRIQKALTVEALDGWLLYDFHGQNKIAANLLGLGDRINTRRWYYFVPSSGEPTRIVHAIESENLDHLPGKKLVFRSWQDLHAALRKVLQGVRKIAMEYSAENDIPYVALVDAGTLELVRKSGTEVVSSGDLVQEFEARWTPEQAKSHFEAAARVNQVKDEGFKLVAESVRAGRSLTEYDVQQWMWNLFEKMNLYADHPAIVAVNENASNPHYSPKKDSAKEIRKGDLLLIDIWGKLKEPDSIYGDITWMGYVGPTVPEKHARIFQIVKAAQMQAFDFIARNFKDGKVTFGWEADEAARSYIAEQGYGDYFLHRTGHSIGREVHGNGAHLDNLETRDRRKLLPQTGFSIEPGIYLPEFGVRSEIDVYIGDEGPVITSPDQKEIIPLL